MQSLYCSRHGNKMNDAFETSAIYILKICTRNRYGMRELLTKLKQNHDKSYNTIEELKNAGFIMFESRRKTHGRPSKMIIPTSLGTKYLRSHMRNQLKRIHLTDDDIRKAIHLADFTERLVKSNINPYDRLVEMNEIAFSIGSSA